MPEVRLIDNTAIMEQLRAIEQNSKLTDAQKFRAAKFVVENAPTIEADIDRAAILRLCNEIEMIIVTVCDTGYTLQDGDVEAIMKRTKAIRKELTGDAGSKTD